MFENSFNVRISNSVAKKILSGNPWIYGESILKQNKFAKTGDLAVIFDGKRNFVGIGIYDEESPIQIRVLHKGRPLKIDENFIETQITKAVKKRFEYFNQDITNAFRLIHGENDGIPGIVLDKYDKTLVLRIDTSAWLVHLDSLKHIIQNLFLEYRIVLRMSRNVLNSKYNNFTDGNIISGNPIENEIIFKENSLKFAVDPIKGQKTGFFLDQRDNRKKVSELSKGKSVINVFSYTGGFSLFAAKGGANKVVSLDISKEALKSAEYNFSLNSSLKKTEHQTLQGDAFKKLNDLHVKGEKFDMVILDPPSFASKKSDIVKAKQAYYKINTLGLNVLKKGGIFVSASCSSRIGKDDFFKIVISALKNKKLRYEIIEKTFHPFDHPIGFKEGEYLKCIYIKIEN